MKIITGALFFALPALAEDLVFDLLIDASVPVVSFQTSPVSQKSWGGRI
jgi:hypothetical protein